MRERDTHYRGWEEEYLAIMSDILHGGADKEGRNGMTRERWGKMVRHDMRAGFPLLTTKQVFYKGAIAELEWILRGRTDLEFLHNRNVKYWDLNYEQSGRQDGTLGPTYGKQMRNFEGYNDVIGVDSYDQLEALLFYLHKQPESRRHLISLWNPIDNWQAALPPCWYSVQFNIEGDYVDILWNQRSADWFLGVPFDMVMMATFLELVALNINKTPRYVVGSFANAHLYHAHLDAAKEQISRARLIKEVPKLLIDSHIIYHPNEPDKLIIPDTSHFRVEGYEYEPAIKAQLL